MLAVEPLRSVKNERESEMLQQSFSMEEEFGDNNLLDIIDFDDILVDDAVLPNFEMDHLFFAQFDETAKIDTAADSVSDAGLESSAPIHEPESEAEPKPEPVVKNPAVSKEGEKSTAKKKVKVDWTAELHRRFVAAVEQLGIDKAVPSRILEIMGIDCLTRHNIASHLQKYRSHRKHAQAREAEVAASWGRQRQMYGTAAAQREAINPWPIAPTLGSPPHFRPLHVWGHPSVDQSLMYTWHKHLASPHAWPPPPPPPLAADPSFWHPHHQYIPPPGTLFFPPPQFPPTRFPPPPAAGVPAVQTPPQPPTDVHPSKESIDAAIGDVIRRPWLPLPLGLKPPSMDGVMVELRRQGVSKIPPT